MTVADAARNNAELCSLVSGGGTFAEDAWTSPTRTPPLYPDAVTLRAGVDAEDLLARIDTSDGCSVKDSFADLDLAGFGFTVLFAAQWIRRDPSPPGGAAERDEELSERTLLDVGGEGWRAVLNRSTTCVGLSNVATDAGGDPDTTWAHTVAVAAEAAPGLPLVGYERDDDLAVALRHGFTPAGPLRVWIRGVG